MADPTQPALAGAAARLAAEPRADTPVASYSPSGYHDWRIPMGKYYPSNWEKRKEQKRLKAQRATPPGTKSEPQVPQYKGAGLSHQRSESEAKRMLQQYQRDMVAQDSMATRELLGEVAKQKASNVAGGASSSVQAIAFSTAFMQLGGVIRKPLSPKLKPLGSPGPVTPMTLEGDADADGGYLTKGLALSAAVAQREQDEVTRAIEVEEQSRQRGRANRAATAAT